MGLKKSANRKVHRIETDVWTLALERVERTYELFDHVSVMFSGGKDSTIALHATLEVAAHLDKGPVRVIHFDEEAIPFQTEDYVRRIAARDDVELEWLCLPVQHRNACSRTHPYWWPWAPEAEHLWCRPMPPEAITEIPGFPVDPPEDRLTIPDTNGLLYPPEVYGNSAMIMGIRGAESITRFQALLKRSSTRLEDYLIRWTGGTARGNIWKSYPVYDWTDEDVWIAPAKFGWDYNEAYDLFEMLGIPKRSARLSPAFGEEPIQKLWMWQEAFPELWDPMTQRVPGAAAAARYSTTEIWGYMAGNGGTVKLPEGMTPQDLIKFYIEKWPEEQQGMIADRIRREVQSHYNSTDDPLLLKTPHPGSGLHWDMLIKIAMRGDFKSRRFRRLGWDIGMLARRQNAWDKEHAEMLEAGEL